MISVRASKISVDHFVSEFLTVELQSNHIILAYNIDNQSRLDENESMLHKKFEICELLPQTLPIISHIELGKFRD